MRRAAALLLLAPFQRGQLSTAVTHCGSWVNTNGTHIIAVRDHSHCPITQFSINTSASTTWHPWDMWRLRWGFVPHQSLQENFIASVQTRLPLRLPHDILCHIDQFRCTLINCKQFRIVSVTSCFIERTATFIRGIAEYRLEYERDQHNTWLLCTEIRSWRSDQPTQVVRHIGHTSTDPITKFNASQPLPPTCMNSYNILPATCVRVMMFTPFSKRARLC